MKKWIWIALLSVVILAGCDLFTRDYYLAENDFPDKNTGTLVMLLDGTSIATKTISPGNMVVDRYDLTFTLPAAPINNFNVDNWPATTPVFTRNGLTPGNWKVAAVAKDSGSVVVGAILGNISSTVDFTINAGLVTDPVSVNTLPIIGSGNLSMTLTWASGVVSSPVTMTAYLVPADATGLYTAYPISPAFTVDTVNRIATYPFTAKTAGYYTLLIQLFGNGVQEWGWTESVRIVTGKTTTGSLNFSGTGGVSVSISSDMKNPLIVTWVSPPPVSIAQGNNIPVTAQLSSSATSGHEFKYQWYRDGLPLSGQISAALTAYGSALLPGDYSLCVVVIERLIALPNTVRTISSNGFTFGVY